MEISIFGSVVKLELLPECLFFSVIRIWNDRKCTMQIPRSELIRNNHDCIDISAGKELIRSLCCRQEGESSQSPPYVHILSKIWKLIFSLFPNSSMILITQPVWPLFFFKSIWTRPQGSQGCQKIRFIF